MFWLSVRDALATTNFRNILYPHCISLRAVHISKEEIPELDGIEPSEQ